MIPGTQGYADSAGDLAARYESLAFEDKHAPILSLLPPPPAPVLDIGAGTGADAAWLAQRGHPVVAVEPTAGLRMHGMALHASTAIEWMDDSLPDLEKVVRRSRTFAFVLLSAVWMHLDERERRAAMPNLAALLAPDGVLALSLRHGPAPAGRRMFDVSAQETIALAQEQGLRAVLEVETPSLQQGNRAARVTWTRLAFRGLR